MRTFYHFTPEHLLAKILREGLKPQPLRPHHQDMFALCADLGIPAEGIYIWPETPEDVLVDFWMYKRMHYAGFRTGVLLEVEVEEAALLTQRWLKWDNAKHPDYKNEMKFWHTLTFTFGGKGEGDPQKRHEVVMEVTLEPVPPTRLRPVKSISFSVVSLLT